MRKYNGHCEGNCYECICQECNGNCAMHCFITERTEDIAVMTDEESCVKECEEFVQHIEE